MTENTTTIPLNQPDAETWYRMLDAFGLAARRLGGHPGPPKERVWGWRGRTVSGPVIIDSAIAWLRLASGRTGEIAHTFWRGNATAEEQLPADVPRPHLLKRDEWETDTWCYNSELFERATTLPLSAVPAPSAPLAADTLPGSWWSNLRASLDAVANVNTRRFTIEPVWAERLVTDYFGPDRAAASPWTTCHGDLHWANLAGPKLLLFDWEGWGSGPKGYDAASLLIHSLLQPDLAAQVHNHFADHLDGEPGRYAQQVIVAEQLRRREETQGDPLVPALRSYADVLRSTSDTVISTESVQDSSSS